ncbi:hypothetical protein BKA69DRAFT_1049373 [Paraphysoderma sedebokerense]|nr:hypothetical protein BKA69DRAFT_1049373 [Paraphysoderma sedebokerense]
MGRIVTPGIIDMHSHAGVDSYPSLRATDDTNEYGDPTIPQMQSIDSFNPHDTAIPLILSGGITTMLTLPGSANLMGGEAFSFKLRKPTSNSVEEMLLNFNLTKENESSVGGKKWRWMKMACGENPKGYGRNENVMPFTRMGNAYVIRKKFSEAHQLMKAQDEWCAFGHEVYRRMTGYEYTESKRKDRKPKRPLPKFVRVMLGQYPENVSLSSTVALLRGEIKLNFHCYETFDMETMLRVTREYGVEVAAFHHALDVYRIPELIKKYSPNTTMAIFSDHWGYKKEAFQASVYAPKILKDNGISFTFKSDHPVIHAQYLAYEAGKSIHFGLTEQDVLKAITSVPAKAMGVDYRIGSIKPGMDGDIVVWSSSPFEIGSMPLKVFVDGVPSFSRDSWPENHHTSVGESPVVPEMSVDGIQQCEDESINDVLIKGVGKLFAGRGKVVEDVQIHIEGGIVKCISARCEIGSGSSPVTFDLHGGNLYPSFVSAGTRIGLFEISQESSTHDGIASTDEYVRASDGLLLGHKHQKLSANFGVNTAISSPMVKSKNGIAAGISVAFRMNATDLNDAIIKDAVALHVVIGNVVKQTDSVMGSVSGQIGELRKRLLKGFQANDNDYFYLVVNGSLPLVIETNMADHIMSIIRLKREIESLRPNPLLPPMKWIIAGASEAHIVAPYLAATGISIIIRPARCIPSDWQTRRCLTPPQSPSHLATVLKKHNVPFVITTDEREISYVRMLPWEANWVRHLTEPKLSEVETVELASFRVSEMFNLVDQGVGVVEVGKRVNVVGVNGSILEMGGGREVQLIVEGKRVTCWPKQD